MSIKKGNKIIAGAPLEAVWGNISGNITDQADLQQVLSEKVGADSPAFIGTPTAPTPPTGSYDDRIATTSYVQQAIESVDGLPSQAGHNGQYLTTNGTSASWATVDALPAQSGQSGKFLTTNGTSASWTNIPEELPSQTGNDNKFLKTNGTSVSWSPALVNESTGTDSLSILAGEITSDYNISIGIGAWGSEYTLAIGNTSYAYRGGAISIGHGASAINGSIAIGNGTEALANAENSIVIGQGAAVTASYGIQLGFGNCAESSTFYVGLSPSTNYKLLDSKGKIPDARLNNPIPSQIAQSGKFLTTNGTTISWEEIPSELPDQSGQDGKFLTTDGSEASWEDIPSELPSQSGQNGKFLTTNGTSVSWESVDAFPTQAGNANKFLTTDGNNVSWATVDALPSQSGQSGKYLTTNGTAASWASLPTYSSGTGISVSGTTINHSNSVTAGTAGTSSATSGSSLAVPYITYDAQGHITASGTHTHTVTGFLTSNDIDQTYSGTSANAQSGVAVKSAIDAAVASVYKPAGSVAFANRPTLASSIEGNVYNITDAFTTTSDFVEGTGHNYPAGTNIVCINTAESGQTAVYKWDVLAGFVDLSGYVTKDGGSAQQTIQLTSGTGTTAFGVKSRSSSSYISLSGTSGWLGSYGVTSDKTPTFYNGTSYTLAYVENTVASNTAITGATKCKITYDSKGLVTAGADLTASDIPNLSLSKITDVTASATELNYVDGVTSNVQTQLDNKPDFTDYGLIVPDTSKMDVLKTITYTVSANTVYRFGNFSNNISNLWDIKGDTIFRITVTGTNINQQIEGIISMRQALESPFIVIRNRRGNSSAATSGIRYIYSRYPKALNSGYNWQFDFACYDATERTIKIEILKNDIGFSWEESLTSSSYDSTYQSSATLTAYTTDGIIGIPTLNWAASSASTAGYLTSYIPKMIGGTQPLAGAALLASQLCFMSSNKMYPSTSKTLPIDTGYGICFNSTATSSGSATTYNYLRQKISATSLTNIPHATLARGNSCYFRCTMDANGNILSDNYVATSMAAGYTWYYIGIAQSSSAINIDTTNSVFLTLDSNGSLTHINGKKITTTDLSNYQTKITSSAKLSADLISDGTTNKIVTATEKSTWSGKQDALVSGTNIKTINNQSILGNGNIDIQGGTTVEAYTASEVQTIWDSVTPT